MGKMRAIQSRAGGGSGIYGGKDDRARTARDYMQKRLLPQERGRFDRADYRNQLYDEALGDPQGMAQMYQGIYGDMIEGYARPREEVYARNSREQSANVASRYGGNVSQEEERQNTLSQEEWAQNIGDIIKQVSGQAVDAGQRQTQMYGQGAQQAGMEQDRLTQMIMQYINMMQEKQGGGWFGNMLGGAAAGFLSGGPAGAGAGAAGSFL